MVAAGAGVESTLESRREGSPADDRLRPTCHPPGSTLRHFRAKQSIAGMIRLINLSRQHAGVLRPRFDHGEVHPPVAAPALLRRFRTLRPLFAVTHRLQIADGHTNRD